MLKNKLFIKKIIWRGLFVAPIFCLVLFFPLNASANLNYGAGYYTNLCGSGTAADFYSCSANCNPATGDCSGNYVVKWTCDGNVSECKNNESAWATYHKIDSPNPVCNKTVQIDVFSKNCRAGGGWSCGDSDLLGYMVWYSGDCDNGCQPINSLVTPNPSNVGDKTTVRFASNYPYTYINLNAGAGLTSCSEIDTGCNEAPYGWPNIGCGGKNYCWCKYCYATNSGTYNAVFNNRQGCSSQASYTVQSQTEPTVDIKANNSDGPISIGYNQAANLTWASFNTDTCTASGNWSGAKVISNASGESTGSLISGAYVYIITCSGASGSATDSVTINVNSQPSFSAALNISKTVKNLSQGYSYYQNVISANPADLLEFKIQVSSTGTSPAYNVIVKDILPSLVNYQGNLLIDGVPITGAGSITSGMNLGTILAGQSKTITFQARIYPESNFGYGTISLVNTAQTWANNVGQINDSATINVARSIPTPQSPGLNVDKTTRNITKNTGFQTSVSAKPLDEIEFKIIIQSIGTTAAQNVTIQDALPAGLNYEGDLEINGLVWGGNIISGINIGSLSAGASKTITFKTKLNSETSFDYGTTTLVNTVSVGADTLSKVYDSAVVNVTRTPIESKKELSVEKKVRNLTSGQTQWYETIYAVPSDKIIFQIKVSNTGNTRLSDIIVKDGLPGKISWYGELEIDNKASSADIVKGINIRDLSAGDEKIITFEALVAGKDEFIYGTTDLINTVMAYNTNDSDTDTAKVRVQKASVAGAVTEIPTGVLDSLVISFGVTVLISYCFLLGHFFYQKTGINFTNQIARTKTAIQERRYSLTIFDSPEKSEKRFQKAIAELRKTEL